MENIKTESVFKEMLAQECAIAFIGFEWSGQSKVSERLVESWEKTWLTQNGKVHSIYRISPDESPFTHSWIAENARNQTEGMEGGFGSVVWLRQGVMARYVRYAAQAGAEKLSAITQEVFGN